MQKLMNTAFATANYNYEEEISPSMSDIYDDSKAVRKRGRQEFLVEVGKQITAGLNAKGTGELELEGGMTVEHICRDEFEEFRKFLGMNDAAFLQSFSEVTGGATSDAGRSGSLYWFSKDGRYLLKSATKDDIEKIEDMMERYLAHFKEAKQAGRPCLLLRLFGAYRFRVGEDTLGLLCMNDVWDGRKPERLYDLKGTTHHRLVEDVKPGVVLKDNNLTSYFVLEEAQAGRLIEAMEEDAEFLEQENSMDYSLLLGVDPPGVIQTPKAGSAQADWEKLPVYDGEEVEDLEEDEGKSKSSECAEASAKTIRMGIIDFLTQWNGKKKAERTIKTFTACCQEHSTQPPDYYKERWVDFMEEKIIVEGSNGNHS